MRVFVLLTIHLAFCINFFLIITLLVCVRVSHSVSILIVLDKIIGLGS